jgi:hypothetical protein
VHTDSTLFHDRYYTVHTDSPLFHDRYYTVHTDSPLFHDRYYTMHTDCSLLQFCQSVTKFMGQTEFTILVLLIFLFEATNDLFRTTNASSTLCRSSHLEKLAVADRSTFQVPSSVIALTEARWIIMTSL